MAMAAAPATSPSPPIPSTGILLMLMSLDCLGSLIIAFIVLMDLNATIG